MIRPGIRPIVIAAIASGIAAKGMEEPDLAQEDRTLFERLFKASDRLVEAWPVRVRSRKELEAIGNHIEAFTNATKWDNRPRNIQTYCHFIAALFEDAREKVTEPKRLAMIDDILDASTALWRRYSSGKDREYEWCLWAGIRAANLWEGIMEGEINNGIR